MKRYSIMLGLVLAMALAFTACNQTTQQEVKEAGEAAKEEAKEAADKATEEAKEAAEKVKEEVKEITDKAKEEIEKAKENLEEKEFTLDELAEFNGQDGKPAYVAVDGVVYDVTDSKAWQEGQHNGFEAGKDLTTEIKDVSPHGVGKLEGIPKVGVLVD